MNDKWVKFKTGLLFVNFFDKFIPSKMTKSKYSMPWIDVTIERLVKKRQKLHLRASKDIDEMNHFKQFKAHTYRSPHLDLKSPGDIIHIVRGDYNYYHYVCDGQDDRGWGCGYRTLQSLCSWTKETLKGLEETCSRRQTDVPEIPQIQEALVTMGDKEDAFRGSRDWIGSVEVGLCIDYFYDVPCKIIHISRGSDLTSHLEEIAKHFVEFGSPIMMGGDSDSSSKGIVGVCLDNPSLLVVDPHFCKSKNEEVSRADLQQKGWISWRHVQDFNQDSFYNMCLPQLKKS